MPEIGTSGSMSEDGKRSVAKWPKLPRLSSTLPQSGRTGASIECLLSGVKRTLPLIVALSAYDPNRSKAASKSALQRAPDLISPTPLSCRPGKGKRMHFDRLRRRDFIRLVGCAAISP